MTETDLTQAEADRLIALPKRRVDDKPQPYPWGGEKLAIPLLSEDGRERFLLDLWHAGIDFAKSTHQTRARQVVPLVRLCIGRPHRNPDGETIPAVHLHHYREGYADKWAEPVPSSAFHTLNDPMTTLDDFMRYCNIVEPPAIQARWNG